VVKNQDEKEENNNVIFGSDMVYKIIGTDKELEDVGLEPSMRGKRVIKLNEFWDGYWKMFYQTCEGGIYRSYDYHIPPYLLSKIID